MQIISTSPKDHALIEALTIRSQAEGRPKAALIRDALAAYLGTEAPIVRPGRPSTSPTSGETKAEREHRWQRIANLNLGRQLRHEELIPTTTTNAELDELESATVS